MERKSVDNSESSSEIFFHENLYTLVNFPVELLVWIISFVSTRDRVNLRYVSQRIRVAVEVPSLWREFVWPNYDFREENAIKSVLETCGRHMKILSFPNHLMPIESLHQCVNVLRLSMPSVNLSLSQMRMILQSMKKLQYLDILWGSKSYIKCLLMMIGYPGCSINELTIRERVKIPFNQDEIHFLLNEWALLKLVPHTINIVTCFYFEVKEAIGQWSCCGIPVSIGRIGHLKVYGSFTAKLTPIPPLLQYQIFGPHYVHFLFVNARNYGLFGLDGDQVLLANRTVDNGDVIYAGVMRKRFFGKFGIYGNPLNVHGIKFMTHFSAPRCGDFCSGHLEQLAIACPNLQQLSLQKNVNCLKNLQGLRAIANGCKELKGLNIMEISVNEVESSVQLWEIFVTLQLTYLCIDLCCLLCYDDEQTKRIIIALHQKCLKMRSLDVYNIVPCSKCFNNSQSLQLSNFPLLIHSSIIDIRDVIICQRLKYLSYGFCDSCADTWWPWLVSDSNLQELYLISCQFTLPKHFMEKVSAHGGLLHVVLDVDDIIQDGVTALVSNSPSLITFHVYTKFESITKDFMLSLKKEFPLRKLFLCGNCHMISGRRQTDKELNDLLIHGNMDCFTFWRSAPLGL